MSTLQHPQEPEDRALPPGVDPTRDVLQPPRAATARPPYQPLAGRAAAATAVLALLLVIDVASVISGYFEVQLFDRLIAGEDIPNSELEASDTRVGMLGLGQAALAVACAIVFISWMHRAYSNIDALPTAHRRYGTGWTIGSWFVPILNFFRPKQIVNDIWRSGRPASEPPPWLMVWWIGFLISGILSRVAIPDLGEDPTLEQLKTDSTNYMVSDGFDAAALVLAILVVRVLTRRQEAAADECRDRPSDSAAPLPWAQPAPAGAPPAPPTAPASEAPAAGAGPADAAPERPA